MKLSHCLPLALSLLLLALVQPARSQAIQGAPKKIDYQGKVLDSAGAPLAPSTPTNYTMLFRIYAAQSGGTSLRTEQQTVTVSNGLFSVRLGEGTQYLSELIPDLSTVFTGSDRFVGVTVVIPPATAATAGEITPRLSFLASPFSFAADRAKTADGVIGVVTATAGSTFSGTVTATGASTFTGTVTTTGATFNGGTYTGGSFAGNGAGLTDLDATKITTGIIPIARGGTGSSTQNFVDLSTAQTIGGAKTYNNNVGIGTAANSFTPLIIKATDNGAGFYGLIKFESFNAANPALNFYYLDPISYGPNGGGLQFYSFNFTPAGNLGIGTSQPGFKLDVNGGIRCIGAVNTSSDARYKTDIRPLSGALETIGALRGVSYDWNRAAFPAKDFPKGRALGFVGQEVEKVLPEAVTKDADGYYSIAYTEVIPVLVEATKELRAENADLHARLAAQEKRLVELEVRDKTRDAKFATIEKLLLSAEKPVVRTASLKKGEGAE